VTQWLGITAVALASIGATRSDRENTATTPTPIQRGHPSPRSTRECSAPAHFTRRRDGTSCRRTHPRSEGLATRGKEILVPDVDETRTPADGRQVADDQDGKSPKPCE
jgi:hypothetical protein